jgi:hypothetical protein
MTNGLNHGQSTLAAPSRTLENIRSRRDNPPLQDRRRKLNRRFAQGSDSVYEQTT